MSENPFISGDIDDVIRALDSKMVRTTQGSFINVDDLREVYTQVREAKVAEQEKPKPKTFAAARALAKLDPQFAQPPKPPTAPAFARVTGVQQEEEEK